MGRGREKDDMEALEEMEAMGKMEEEDGDIKDGGVDETDRTSMTVAITDRRENSSSGARGEAVPAVG